MKITLEIEGMMCGMCESHINNTIRSNFTVKKVKSSHRKGKTIITTEENIDKEALKNVIAETGYTLKSIEIS